MKKLILLLAALVVTVSLTSCNKEVVKTYSATISQSGTNAPEANVFSNEIGDITWEYVSEGIYHGKREGGFPLDKTILFCNNGVDGAVSGDLRHYSEDFIELRTFAGINEFSGLPDASNGYSGISIQIKIKENKRP